MSGIDVNSLANAWRRVRDDVNMLAWLFEEEREIQRLYLQTVLWSQAEKRVSVEEFKRSLGSGAADQGSADDSERSASGALE